MNTSQAYAFPGIKGIINLKLPNNYILETTAKHFGLDYESITKKTRLEDIRLPRQIAMYLYKKHTSLSLKTIGKICGNKVHCTVLNAVRKVDEMIETNYKSVAEDIRAIESELK